MIRKKQACLSAAALTLVAVFTYSCGNSTQPETKEMLPDQETATMATNSRKKPDGQRLFVENCASCHQKDRDAIGPALRSVVGRWEGDTARLRRYIRNNVEMTQDGDLHAEALQEHWNGNMPLFLDFTDEDIDAILSYVESK